MTLSLRACRRKFAAPFGTVRRPPPAVSDPGHTFRDHTRRFAVAQGLVRAFYAFLLYLACLQLTELAGLTRQTLNLPLWPVAWLGPNGTASAAGVRALFFFYVGSNALAALLPGWRALRLLAFVGLLEYVALKNSFGKISHSFHLPLLVAGVLVFLPTGWERPAPRTDRRLRQAALLVFWACQAAVLLTYTMSGLGKLGGALYQLATLQPNAFGPGAFGAHIAQRLLQTHSQSDLGAWIIRHPLLTWPLMPGAIYLELFSFWIAFRPALGRAWAAVLIAFHFGTFFTMTILFPQSCFLLALLFFQSPFAPDRPPGPRALLAQVPLLGEALELLTSRRGRNVE